MAERFITKTEHIGAVTGYTNIKDITLSCAAETFAANDLVADAQEIKGAFRVPGGTGIVHAVRLLDDDDQGTDLDLYFVGASDSWGTEGSALAPTDAEAAEIFGSVSIESGDYTDLIASQEATKTNLNIPVKAPDDGTSLWIVAVTRGTPTYTASGLHVRVTILLD